MIRKRLMYLGIGGIILIVIVFVTGYAHFFGPADPYATQTEFIVQQGEDTYTVIKDLKAQGFIRSQTALTFAYARHATAPIRPGGYELSASMDAWSIATALSRPPYLVFFTFPPGWRKEQIADKLTSTLGWTAAQKQEWLTVDTAPSPSYVEGVYFPDTYLIPSDQTPAQIASRFRDRFQQEFAPLASEAQQQGESWTTVLTLASLIEREAAGSKDMPIIAGIMSNRLAKHMPLQIDATLQYAVGNEANWWPVPKPADKFVDSPFNTYRHPGLPPHPIDEPSLAAITAVLNPTKTDCLYYLHAPDRQIHCSATYAGQVANVNRYLK